MMPNHMDVRGLHIRTRPHASKLDILSSRIWKSVSQNCLGGVFQFSHTHFTSHEAQQKCSPRVRTCNVIGKQQLRPLCAHGTSFFKWAQSGMQCMRFNCGFSDSIVLRAGEKSIRGPHTGRSQCEAIMLPTWLSSSNAVMNVVLFITPRSVFQTLLPLSAPSDAGTSNESSFFCLVRWQNCVAAELSLRVAYILPVMSRLPAKTN